MTEVDVSPTRMELLSVNSKIALARRGLDMLKKKRDTLITEQMKAIEELNNYRKEMEEMLSESYRSAKLAELAMGSLSYLTTAYDALGKIALTVSHKKIVGVNVPILDARLKDGEWRSYSLNGTPACLDGAAMNLTKAALIACRLASLEKKVHVLSDEIRKTRRKVNALEKVKITDLEAASTYIRGYLDEMEREDYSRLKHIKESIKKREGERGREE